MPQNLAGTPASTALSDGRQSKAALDIARGTSRCLLSLGFARVPEVTLSNGRRADLIGINPAGRIWIIEIKSSLADYRADQKWTEYRDYCDQFYFAVGPDFPIDILPSDVGIIVADAYAGDVLRADVDRLLPAARRKDVTLRFGRVAALRLHNLADPGIAFEG